jgi:hypothetical protein
VHWGENIVMPLDFLLAAKALVAPISEFLLKRYVGEAGAAAGKGLIEIAGKVAEDGATQHEAKLRFEDLAHKVVKRLIPLFEKLPSNSAEAIALELATTLSRSLSVELLVEADLDPVKLTTAFRGNRPLPQAVFGEDETALYDQALEETARYLLSIANTLPGFEPTAFGAILARIGRMGDDFEQALSSIARIENALTREKDEKAARANRFEADYRQAVIQNLDFLEIFGADISDEARRHRLSVGYISLTISMSDDEETRETVSATKLSLMFGSAKGRVLIRGEAGSGKSTLLRWIAMAAAKTLSLSPELMLAYMLAPNMEKDFNFFDV